MLRTANVNAGPRNGAPLGLTIKTARLTQGSAVLHPGLSNDAASRLRRPSASSLPNLPTSRTISLAGGLCRTAEAAEPASAGFLDAGFSCSERQARGKVIGTNLLHLTTNGSGPPARRFNSPRTAHRRSLQSAPFNFTASTCLLRVDDRFQVDDVRSGEIDRRFLLSKNDFEFVPFDLREQVAQHFF